VVEGLSADGIALKPVGLGDRDAAGSIRRTRAWRRSEKPSATSGEHVARPVVRGRK